MSKVLIVGGVAGGMSAAARLRRLDESSQIIVFERGDYVSYANCGLPYYVGDAITDRDKLLLQTPESFKRRFDVEVRISNEVLAVDTAKKCVRVKDLKSGREYEETYDKLLLSPGGSPVRPPIPGIDNPAIHTLWTIPDTDALKAVVDGGAIRNALVVGAGFIGLEMAENLHAKGIHVTVVEMAKQVMNVIDYEMASIVHRELRQKKVNFLLEDGVESFSDGGSGRVLAKLNSGKEILADLVLLSIGVKPNTAFLKSSGIELNTRGGIVVDAQLRTSAPEVWAAGDAIEVVNPFTGKKGMVPLAGPANKQGRIAADNMYGQKVRTYDGTMGTAVAKVFDLTVGVTGATEKFCTAENIPFRSVIIHPNDHAGYYPGATMMSLKLVYSPETRKILGAQSVGYNGVDKRIDVIATAIKGGMTVDDLTEIEHAYAPPYSAAKDPVNMAGFAAQNELEGLVKNISWNVLRDMDRKEVFMLDVRTPAEVRMGAFEGAANIPVDDLRMRMAEVPKDKPVVVYCRVGLRGYIAARILAAAGYTDVVNLSGGFETWHLAVMKQDNPETKDQAAHDEGVDTGMAQLNVPTGRTIEVNACGLQCPGPIMRLKQEMDKVGRGDVIHITASDPGFFNDAPAWAKATGNMIRELSLDKGIVSAMVERGPGTAQGSTLSAGNDKTMVVFSGDLDKAIAAFIIANGALSMGRKVTMFFTFWGLNILRKNSNVGGLKKNIIETMFGMMMPRGSHRLLLSKMSMGGMGGAMIRGIMKNKNVPALEDMIAAAIKGGANIVACQMSMDLMGIKNEELIDGVQIGGVASYIEASEHADNNLFI